MQVFVFIGKVQPDTIRVTSAAFDVRLEAGADCPEGVVTVEIENNRVIGAFKTDQDL